MAKDLLHNLKLTLTRSLRIKTIFGKRKTPQNQIFGWNQKAPSRRPALPLCTLQRSAVALKVVQPSQGSCCPCSQTSSFGPQLPQSMPCTSTSAPWTEFGCFVPTTTRKEDSPHEQITVVVVVDGGIKA
jgi:hypothetical protein